MERNQYFFAISTCNKIQFYDPIEEIGEMHTKMPPQPAQKLYPKWHPSPSACTPDSSYPVLSHLSLHNTECSKTHLPSEIASSSDSGKNFILLITKHCCSPKGDFFFPHLLQGKFILPRTNHHSGHDNSHRTLHRVTTQNFQLLIIYAPSCVRKT